MHLSFRQFLAMDASSKQSREIVPPWIEAAVCFAQSRAAVYALCVFMDI